VPFVVKAFAFPIAAIPHFPDYQIIQLPNVLGTPGDTIRDGERGTPRMFAS